MQTPVNHCDSYITSSIVPLPEFSHLSIDSPTMSKSDYSSDSDSAPEEEGLGTAQQDVQSQLQEREEALRREQRLLKEQRRRQVELYTRQKEEKESRIGEKLAEMPLELLETLESTEKSQKKEREPKRAAQQHITFAEELIDDEPVSKRPMYKKRTLAKLRATAAKKGPVTVQLLQQNSQLPPKAERVTVNDRDKWLRRKSLKRK